MSVISFEKAWRDDVKRREADLREIDAHNDDAFRNWERNSSPETEAADQLFLATDILYGQGDRELARRFLRQAIAVAERAFAEDKVRKSKWCQPGFPKNRGEAEKIRVYAKALLGQKFDPARRGGYPCLVAGERRLARRDDAGGLGNGVAHVTNRGRARMGAAIDR